MIFHYIVRKADYGWAVIENSVVSMSRPLKADAVAVARVLALSAKAAGHKARLMVENDDGTESAVSLDAPFAD
jgi:hypothetical protein